MVSELRFYRLVGSGQQVLATVVTQGPGGVSVEGDPGPAQELFYDADLTDPLEVMAIMQAAPVRFDGAYLRAQYLEYGGKPVME